MPRKKQNKTKRTSIYLIIIGRLLPRCSPPSFKYTRFLLYLKEKKNGIPLAFKAIHS